jgi:hypothetical protein
MKIIFTLLALIFTFNNCSSQDIITNVVYTTNSSSGNDHMI